jgi:hypothetical protein
MKQALFWFIIVGVGFSIGACRGCHRAAADYVGDSEEIWQVRGDGEKRIADYHWFYDMYEQIQAQDAKIRRYEADSTLAQQMIMNHDNWVSEYNARSRAYDRVMWKGENLPQRLEYFKW